MSDHRTSCLPHRRTEYYGTFAFGAVILSCFAQFVFARRITGELWQVPATFGLGATYAALAILGDGIVDRWGLPWKRRIFLAMWIVVVAMIYLSPVRGFFGIMVLPLLSYGIFLFGWKGATASGLSLFAASIFVFGYYYGPNAMIEASMSYLAAFAFTAMFTVITKKALTAREQSEALRLELEVANQKLHAYAAQIEELATTRERNRLAREIHDGVGHYLTVVKTQLDAAAGLIGTDTAKARTNVEKAAKLTAEALDDVRRSVSSLKTDAVRAPLAEAVQHLASLGEPTATVTILGTPRQLPPATEHALFRATQEGLTNIRKHARATNALITLDFRDAQSVRLEMADNGVGANVANGDGFGLHGMAERLALLGGTVNAGNRLEGGFALSVEVPAPQPAPTR
ncbi:MAG: sensor histidine kinase [Candidatus Didemnitutus sp.]|nr:sensor histidine kinase [Candidatus Didemnitutus sp.]